jgi:hypothetical protein
MRKLPSTAKYFIRMIVIESAVVERVMIRGDVVRRNRVALPATERCFHGHPPLLILQKF